MLGLTGATLDGASATASASSASASASASSSSSPSACSGISFATQGAPGTTAHIFSHVVHDLTVHHWRLQGGGGGGAAAEAARSGLLARVTRPGLEAQWCDLPSLASGVGLTSWAARVLFVALREEARAFFSAEEAAGSGSSGSGGGSSSGSGSSEELAQAWRTLRDRWSKGGCKLS